MTTSGLGLPLVLASAFTLGCIVIQTAGRRAEADTEGSGFLFLICVLLNGIALPAFFLGARISGIPPIRSLSAG